VNFERIPITIPLKILDKNLPSKAAGRATDAGVMCMKLLKIIVTGLMLSSISAAFGQSVEELEMKHLSSIATPEGKAYESIAMAEFQSDLSFMPKCAGRTGINSGAVTIYFEVNSSGDISSLYMTPDSVFAKCIHPLLITREFTPPPNKWVGKITISISQ
jgi:hypothetical protein